MSNVPENILIIRKFSLPQILSELVGPLAGLNDRVNCRAAHVTLYLETNTPLFKQRSHLINNSPAFHTTDPQGYVEVLEPVKESIIIIQYSKYRALLHPMSRSF